MAKTAHPKNPTVITKKSMALEIFEKKAGNVSQTCKELGIDRSTFYEYCSDVEFKRKANEIREGLVDFAESKLLKKINDEDMTAIIFFLKCQGKSRGYVERGQFEGATVNIGQIIGEQRNEFGF